MSEPTTPSPFAHAKTVLRRLGPAGPLAVVSATLPVIGLVTLAALFNTIGPWLRGLGLPGLAAYAVCFAICAGLAILPTHIQAALGGWAFGFALGFPAAMFGVVLASILGYAIALRAAGDRALALIAEKPKWKAVADSLLGSGFWRTLLIVTLVRVPPSSPFALTNLVLGVTRVNRLAYALGTALGIAPRTAAVVFLAVGVQQLGSRGPDEPRWLWVAGIVLTIAVLMVLGAMANRAVARVTGSPTGAEAEASPAEDDAPAEDGAPAEADASKPPSSG
jgi:uncharacterized membrane protein YdjX (TVP38/TMEM64 family)